MTANNAENVKLLEHQPNDLIECIEVWKRDTDGYLYKYIEINGRRFYQLDKELSDER